MKLIALLAASVLGAAADDQVCKAPTDEMKAMPTCGSTFTSASSLTYVAFSADDDPFFSSFSDEAIQEDLDAYIAAETAAGRTVSAQCSDELVKYMCMRDASPCEQEVLSPLPLHPTHPALTPSFAVVRAVLLERRRRLLLDAVAVRVVLRVDRGDVRPVVADDLRQLQVAV